MKVSDRIQEIRNRLNDDVGVLALRTALNSQLTQLEIDVVDALLVARQEGHVAGYDDIMNAANNR